MDVDRSAVFRLGQPAGGSGSRRALALVLPLLERLLGLAWMDGRYRGIPPGLSAAGFVDWALGVLDVGLRVEDTDLARIPERGPLVVVANHPFGGIEGLALAKLLLARRSDVKIPANPLLARIPEFRDLVLPIDPFGRPQSVRANLAAVRAALRWVAGGGAIALFPSGEVSHLDLRRLAVEDPPWLPLVETLVRRTRSTVVPVFFPGRNGFGFQAAGLVHPRLRTVLLGRQLLRRRGETIEARVGSPIAWRTLAPHSGDGELASYLRGRTYILAERPPLAAAAVQPRATPRQSRPLAAAGRADLIEDEVRQLPPDRLLVDGGDEVVYVAAAHEIPTLLREIGRERERTFREVGEGTGRELDLDVFDRTYRHLFVWSRVNRELVGAYRIGRTDELLDRQGTGGLYTSTLFSYKPRLFETLGPALEMGRSFIRPEYQKSYAGLLLLWKGIGQLVLREPRYATLFGPVSISAEYRSASQRLLVAFLEQNRYVHEASRWVRPRRPAGRELHRGLPVGPARLRDLEEVSNFISEIEADQKGVPILLRQYLKLGGRLLGFNVDPDFSDVLDVLIMVDLRRTDEKILARYMGRGEAAAFLAHHRAPSDLRSSAG